MGSSRRGVAAGSVTVGVPRGSWLVGVPALMAADRKMRRKRPSSWPARGRRREHMTRAKAAPGAGTFLAPVDVSVFRHPDGRRVWISPHIVTGGVTVLRHCTTPRRAPRGAGRAVSAARSTSVKQVIHEFAVRQGTVVDNRPAAVDNQSWPGTATLVRRLQGRRSGVAATATAPRRSAHATPHDFHDLAGQGLGVTALDRGVDATLDVVFHQQHRHRVDGST